MWLDSYLLPTVCLDICGYIKTNLAKLIINEAIMTHILLAVQYWKYITIALLSVEHELGITTMKAEYVDTAREIERKAYAQQIEAINEYKKREEVILASVGSANESVSRLSNTLNQVSSAAKYDASLRDKYIDTSRGIIEECSVGYRQVGEIAERLNSEVKLLRDSRS